MTRSACCFSGLLLALAALVTWRAHCAEDHAPVTNDDAKALVKSNNTFASVLFAALAAKDQDNLFISPYSLSTALTMTYTGARTETEKEMAKVLQFSMPQARVPALFADQLAQLQDVPKDNKQQPAYELNIANRLFAMKGFNFLPEFLTLNNDSFGAPVEQVDFLDEPAARKLINGWVEKQTHDRIKDLIPAGILDNNTRLVLTNAIYFKGDWEIPFTKEGTRDVPFTLLDGKAVQAPTMHHQAHFKYLETPALQAIELPYKGGRLAMLVLLPAKTSSVDALIKDLSAENLSSLATRMAPELCNLALPKFKLAWGTKDLVEPLKALGMKLAFNEDHADFSGMTGKKELFIKYVLHKACVDVDEKGSEAAAATAVIMAAPTGVAPRPQKVNEMHIDRPFVFMIRDTTTGQVLFTGRITDPTK